MCGRRRDWRELACYGLESRSKGCRHEATRFDCRSRLGTSHVAVPGASPAPPDDSDNRISGQFRPAPWYAAFERGLNDLGYVQGRTIAIEHRSAAGQAEGLPALAAELVGLQPKVIV